MCRYYTSLRQPSNPQDEPHGSSCGFDAWIEDVLYLQPGGDSSSPPSPYTQHPAPASPPPPVRFSPLGVLLVCLRLACGRCLADNPPRQTLSPTVCLTRAWYGVWCGFREVGGSVQSTMPSSLMVRRQRSSSRTTSSALHLWTGGVQIMRTTALNFVQHA